MRRSGFKGLVAAGLVATSIASSTSVVSASSNIFLKLGDIKGESTDAKHKDEIEVLSWSWGVSQSTGRIKRGTVAPQCIQDLTLTKFVDSASAQIIMAAVKGEIAKEATLTLRKAGGDQQDYLIIKMNDVLVTSYQTGGSAGGNEAQVTDVVVLNFSSIEGEYRPQSPDGKLGNAVRFNIPNDCPSDPGLRQQ
jgi:type VI secretion system secreted protein Hcp